MKINWQLVIVAVLLLMGGAALLAVQLDRANQKSDQALAIASANDARLSALEGTQRLKNAQMGIVKRVAKALLGWIPGLGHLF